MSFGFGVTAWSVEDALRLISAEGYGIPSDLNRIRIQENVSFAELDQFHVVPNMGPMVMRGVWYPRCNLRAPPPFLGN